MTPNEEIERDIFSRESNDNNENLESVKVEEEIIENENYKFDVNWSHEIDTAEEQEDLEIDAFEDRHKDSENYLPLIAFGSKSKTDDIDIEQPCIQTNNFSKPCEKKITSNSTDCNINDVSEIRSKVYFAL
ncbi:unnamed protein product [Parnassius apollo]|uniref:(apollo) hypothetical protein n=1 Tax=Parnassius apollo TaxID=110799 RepID=A0A8S3WFN1_PARAO|nr:unnamed protein product [Parnassius apollo]